MTIPPQTILPDVIAAVAEAGRRIAEEFALPGGPRLIDHVTAPIDREVELYLRDVLVALVPARFVGEEAGVVAAEANGLCWVVDPHDGTRAFLEGKRGSAVSVALLRRGIPVLGVVFAPLCPDRGPDMIAWAEGGGITRNGVPVSIDLRERGLRADDVVFLNHGVWQRPVWNSIACAPARFMPLPSIAYRLARIAVGDGIATQTLRPVNALDIAAGHALLTAAGGILVAEDGEPVTYNEMGESRPSACFGGAPGAVAILRGRAWRGSTETRREPRVTLHWPRAPESTALDRAVGCLLGLVIGDSLGGQVEGQSSAEIVRTHPDGVRHLYDGPVWRTLAGQPTDDSELAMALARALLGQSDYHPDTVARAYADWYRSAPFACGPTSARAFAAADDAAQPASSAEAAADRASRSNGSLMRVAPISLWARSVPVAAETAMRDSRLSHPHPVCQAACGALAGAIAAAIQGADRAEMTQVALRIARDVAGGDPVVAALSQAAQGRGPVDFESFTGFVLVALQNAFAHLAAGADAETALVQTIARGGDTDTNAAIVGALLGAADGRLAFPTRWVMPVLTCRPDAGMNVERPRPDTYWPDDLIELAEALLLSRTAEPRKAS